MASKKSKRLKLKKRKSVEWFGKSAAKVKKIKRHQVEKKRKAPSGNVRGALNEDKVRKIKAGLRAARKNPKITQTFIAQKMGVSQALISQIKSGKIWQDVKI